MPRAIRNLQKKSLPHSSCGLGAISHKLIFDIVVFVGNRAIGPTYERVLYFVKIRHEVALGYDKCAQKFLVL